jgi:hypothetical protein
MAPKREQKKNGGTVSSDAKYDITQTKRRAPKRMSIFTRAPHTPSISSVSERVLREIQEGIRDGDGDNLQSQEVASHEEKERAPLKRLVVRDMPFHQSSNSLRIRHQISPRSRGPMNVRFWYFPDWFHVFLRLRTEVSVLLFVALWTALIVIFAGLYYGVDSKDAEISCGLGHSGNPISFHGAFAFSLETATTVGYGIPNGGNFFFENCPLLQVTLYFQMVITMFFNAFIISFVYSRMSRSETRATQFLFSQKATLNREVTPSGIVRHALSVQIFDADSMYPLMEAHVRFYAVKHGEMHAPRNEGVLFPVKMEPMRVSVPNDDLGADLYTSMPMTATHYIDHHSPINPPSRRAAGPEDGRVNPGSGFVMDYCGMMLRENDAYTNGRDGLRCAICGETFATVANLVQHIRYYQFSERHESLPIVGSHQELDVEALFKEHPIDHMTRKVIGKEGSEAAAADAKIDIDCGPPPFYDEFRSYYKRANVEIICVVEAIDPILSGTFHAVQSYTIDDIVFDADFAPCVLADVSAMNKSWLVNRSAAGCSMKVDLDSFHCTVPLKSCVGRRM